MRLYHYTNYFAYQSIFATKEFKPSTNTAVDAGYGMGWYFTDISPDSCEIQIYNECFGGPNPNKRIDYYLYIDIPDRYIKKGKNHIYLVPIDAKLGFTVIAHGRKNDCPNKPCETCPNYTAEKKDTANDLANLLGVAILGGLILGGVYFLAKAFARK